MKFLKGTAIKEDMSTTLTEENGLTDCAVFSVVAGTSTVTLILVLTIPDAHTPVLTGEGTAWIDCGK